MPSFFRRKPKPSPSATPAFRSVENLPSSPPPGVDDLDRRFSVSTQPHAAQAQPAASSSSSPSPFLHQSHHPLRLSHQNLDRLVASSSSSNLAVRRPSTALATAVLAPDHHPRFDADSLDQSCPPPPQPPPQSSAELPRDHNQDPPKKSKRTIFSLHSSPVPRESTTGFLGRKASVRKKSPSDRSQTTRPLSVDTTSRLQQQQQQHRPATSPADDALDPHSSASESPMPQHAGVVPPDLRPPPRSPQIPSIQRSNTDSTLNLYRPSPIEPPRHPAELTPGPQFDQFSHRPPSRQSIGPPSPLPPPVQTESSDTVLSGMSDRPTGGPTSTQAANSPYPPEAVPRSSVNSQQQNSDNGRSTPSRGRDDNGEVDVRALMQKHDELQAKYSKVKRYYFEKDAQVQHLQNTVAHQRMAVSRTVLDDNEYANRFGRLDGAIKDLSFAIRKDWKSLPPWLVGYVNDDAHTTGTKEMTAIGRAMMSRWLVDELFECHFHPALESTLSRQLKSIEMNLRRQRGNTATEEDKENAVARISNWRRTTLDGLTDALQGPAADQYRSELIERLVSSLVSTLYSHLQDPPPPGIENGARMIIENAVGIAEKIPLESRDVCVEYVHPGTPVNETTMKIETGIPGLTNVSNESIAARGSADQDRSSEGGAEKAEGGGEEASGSGKRSVFSSFMGRRGGEAPAGNGDSGPGRSPMATEERSPVPSAGKVRFASFVTAEVRGRGPLNVLVKAPVYAME